MTNYLKKAIHSVILLVVFALLGTMCSYGTRIILARNLTTEEYGLFYAVFAFVGFLSLANNFGLQHAFVKFVPEFIHNKEWSNIKKSIVTVTATTLVISVLMAGLMYLLAPVLAINYFKSQGAIALLGIFALMYVFNVFENITISSFHGFQRFGVVSIINFVKAAALVALVALGFFFFEPSLMLPAIAYAAIPIIIFVFFFPYFVTKIFPFFKEEGSFSKPLLKKFMGFGIPVLLAVIGKILMTNSQTVILTLLTSLEDVSMFNIALPTANILNILEVALITVLVPMVSELWVKQDKERIIQGINFIYKYLFILLIPIVFILISYPEFIIQILFGAKYLGAKGALRVLSFGALFWTMSSINVNILSALGKPREYSKIMFGTAIINILLCVALVFLWRNAVEGAAIAMTLSYAIMMLWSFGSVRKIIEKIEFPIRLWRKLILFGFIFLGILFIMKIIFAGLLHTNVYVDVILSLVIAGTSYTGLILWSKIITIREIKKFSMLLFKKS